MHLFTQEGIDFLFNMAKACPADRPPVAHLFLDMPVKV